MYGQRFYWINFGVTAILGRVVVRMKMVFLAVGL